VYYGTIESSTTQQAAQNQKGKNIMLRELNECIDSKGFASLILDYEWFDYVSCRILVEDLFQTRISAANRDEAIKVFRSGSWKA
jgi:hypothetical protein